MLAALTWLFNPYAAALLLPAAHLWLLAAAPGSRLRGPWAALPVALGVAPPLLALLHYATALDLNPLSLAWLLALATADGHIGSPPRSWPRCGSAAWPGCSWSCACAAGSRRRPSPSARARAARPATPGPGSLGGTESALRR